MTPEYIIKTWKEFEHDYFIKLGRHPDRKLFEGYLWIASVK